MAESTGTHPLIYADEQLEKAIIKLKKRLSDEGTPCQTEVQEFEKDRQTWYHEQDHLRREITIYNTKVKHFNFQNVIIRT